MFLIVDAQEISKIHSSSLGCNITVQRINTNTNNVVLIQEEDTFVPLYMSKAKTKAKQKIKKIENTFIFFRKIVLLCK